MPKILSEVHLHLDQPPQETAPDSTNHYVYAHVYEHITIIERDIRVLYECELIMVEIELYISKSIWI